METKAGAKPDRTSWGLWRRRECWVPSGRGWLVLGLLAAGLALAAGTALHPFLAPNTPVRGEVLVVEGWAPDYVLQAAIAEFKSHPYQRIYVTGGPLEAGAPLFQYKNYAERGAATMIAFGLSRESVQAVAAPRVERDRTYTSAVALKRYLLQHGGLPQALDVVTVGPHARRTRLLFAYALSPQTRVGILAVPSSDYNPRRWWKSSAGVRAVLDEAIAYVYAKLFFSPAQAFLTFKKESVEMCFAGEASFST